MGTSWWRQGVFFAEWDISLFFQKKKKNAQVYFKLSKILSSQITSRRRLLYTREDIPSELLKRLPNCAIKTLLVKINLWKNKWFLNESYNPNENEITQHLECLNHLLEKYSYEFEKCLYVGDLNVVWIIVPWNNYLV